jgi:CRISPR/Cas system-associated endonuclease Cas1
MIKRDDFVVDEGLPRSCLLTKAGRGKFLAAYQGRMLTVFTHPGAGCRVSYRVGLCLQARALAEELLHAGGRYEPLVWK